MGPLRAELRAASWFAALGEPLTEGDLTEARAYAGAEADVRQVTSWAEAETFLKSTDAGALAWWDREEALRKQLLARAEATYPERALWTSLTELTTEAGDLVHGKAATAAARMGGAQPASIHVAAGGLPGRLSTRRCPHCRRDALALRKQVQIVRRRPLAARRYGL